MVEAVNINASNLALGNVFREMSDARFPTGRGSTIVMVLAGCLGLLTSSDNGSIKLHKVALITCFSPTSFTGVSLKQFWN